MRALEGAADKWVTESILDDAHGQSAEAVRAFVAEAPDSAKFGDAALPPAMAGVATILWSRFIRFAAQDPRWPDRDRFVLSANENSVSLDEILRLTGHSRIGSDSVKRFRQQSNSAAGHPVYEEHSGIETTSGSFREGVATAVGIALAERILAARFGRSLVDHRTWVIGSDGDLMEGVSHEAVSLAGHLRLRKLTILWDEDHTSGEWNDPLKQFAACGWAAKRVDANDTDAIVSALSQAIRSKKPTLIACRSQKNPYDQAKSPGIEDVGHDGWSPVKTSFSQPRTPFQVHKEVIENWCQTGLRGTSGRRSWLKRLNNHAMRAEFERVMAGRLPEFWSEAAAAVKAEIAANCPMLSTWQSSQRILRVFSAVTPELVGGAPEPAPNHIKADHAYPITWDNFCGRHIDFGIREHGMAACLNGMALHSGLIPYGAAPLAYTDAWRPALRLAAIMRQRVVYVLTHGTVSLGQNGRPQQPVEHLACLRATPGLSVLRPADGMETAECLELALRRATGPSLLVLSHQPVQAVRSDAGENRCARGGYVLAEADGPRQATLIATGSEVAIAMEARHRLASDGIPVAVVSLPCWDLFAAQDQSYRAAVLGAVLRVGIEAACEFGWERWLGFDGVFIGMPSFGEGAPPEDLIYHFGITADAIVSAVIRRLH